MKCNFLVKLFNLRKLRIAAWIWLFNLCKKLVKPLLVPIFKYDFIFFSRQDKGLNVFGYIPRDVHFMHSLAYKTKRKSLISFGKGSFLLCKKQIFNKEFLLWWLKVKLFRLCLGSLFYIRKNMYTISLCVSWRKNLIISFFIVI